MCLCGTTGGMRLRSFLMLNLVALPSSGKGYAAGDPPSNIRGAAVIQGSGPGVRCAYDTHPSEPRRVALVREGRAGNPPPNIYSVAFVRGEDVPLVLLLFSWPCQGGTRRQSSPKYSRWQSSPEPRRLTLFGEGRAGDLPPNVRGVSRPWSFVA